MAHIHRNTQELLPDQKHEKICSTSPVEFISEIFPQISMKRGGRGFVTEHK